MSDFAIDECIELLMDTIEALVPKSLADVEFLRYSGPVPIEEIEGPPRSFAISVASLQLADGVTTAKAGTTQTWFSIGFEVKIFYPKAFMWEGDTALRNVDKLKLQDAVQIIMWFVYGMPLDPLDVDTYALALVGASLAGQIVALGFELRWSETIEAL